MKHRFDIWSKRKNDGRGYLIETSIVIIQEDMEEMVTKFYLEQYSFSVMEDREYWAELKETIHD